MSDVAPGFCVLPVDAERLDAALVSSLDAQIRAVGASSPQWIVIDCHKLSAVTPAGLTALLELGTRVSSIWRVVLTGLSRNVTLAAVQVGLAERFPIYVSSEAARLAWDRERSV